MQDIKFRAWYKPFKDNDFGAGYKYGNNVISFHDMSAEKYEVEQYTGLKDINGTNIYVGDVVQPVRIMKVITETIVQPLSDKPIIVRGDTYVNSKWIARSVSATGFSVEDYYFGNEIQIIGNIHQNPELLED